MIGRMVSVVIPAFNAARTIGEAVDSVLQQTYSDLELIVVNDGSTDETVQRLNLIRDRRLALLSIPHSGPAAARNRGIAAARGAYIAFLDADDVWLPGKLAAQVAVLESRPEVGAVYGFLDGVDADGNERRPLVRQAANGWILETLLVWNVVGNGSNLLVRRSALDAAGVFNESLACVEDWELSIRLAKHCQFACVPKPLSLYRQGRNTLSWQLAKMQQGYRRAVELAYSDVPPVVQRLRPLSLAVFYHYLAGKAWKRGRSRALSALIYSAKSIYYAERAKAQSGQPTFYPFASKSAMRGGVRPVTAAWRTLFPARNG